LSISGARVTHEWTDGTTSSTARHRAIRSSAATITSSTAGALLRRWRHLALVEAEGPVVEPQHLEHDVGRLGGVGARCHLTAHEGTLVEPDLAVAGIAGHVEAAGLVVPARRRSTSGSANEWRSP